MHRFVILILALFYTSVTLAGPNYQIDLILFAHAQNTDNASEFTSNSTLVPVSKNAIVLKNTSTGGKGSYQLLKTSQSALADEYYQLNHKPRYQVLAHYSWLQPVSNQSSVAIPTVSSKGWLLQGTLRVRQSNYYVLDSELQFSPPNAPQSAFTVNQKQRLKPNVVYYLDNPRIGMLIKIHTV